MFEIAWKHSQTSFPNTRVCLKQMDIRFIPRPIEYHFPCAISLWIPKRPRWCDRGFYLDVRVLKHGKIQERLREGFTENWIRPCWKAIAKCMQSLSLNYLVAMHPGRHTMDSNRPHHHHALLVGQRNEPEFVSIVPNSLRCINPHFIGSTFEIPK